MSGGLKKFLRYLVVIAFTILLLWIAFNNIQVVEGETKFGFLKRIWDNTHKPFIILSAFTALLSHYLRSERWKLLLAPLEYPLKSSHGFMSVMVGYFVNLAIPRGGELSRCYTLFKLNKTPVDISFGTVISERIIDLLFLLTLIGTVFIIQLDTFLSFFRSIQFGENDSSILNNRFFLITGGLAATIIISFIIVYFLKKHLFANLLHKLTDLLQGVKSGVLSIFKLEKRVQFVLYSLGIWICYYLMNYFVMQAFPATADLGMTAALTIFVIGGIALAIPLPGGAGSYHLLVSAGLVFIYGVANDQATAFSVIVHAWQTLILIVVGAGSLLLSQFYYRNRKANE